MRYIIETESGEREVSEVELDMLQQEVASMGELRALIFDGMEDGCMFFYDRWFI